MRWIVFGAGAIGGVVGARLALSGHDVALIARGAHRETIAREGLRLVTPEGSTVFDVPVVADPAEAGITGDDVVLLAVKSHHTPAALEALVGCAPVDTPLVSLQNGVANERTALRYYERVYGVCVMCPAAHLEPGVVVAYSSPITGLLDIGRYPSGTDDLAGLVANAFERSTFESVVRPDIMRWKHTKLLMNLGNAVEAIAGMPARFGAVAKAVRAEGERVLHAAGIDFASRKEDKARRGERLTLGDVPDQPYGGGSTWQSLRRGTGSVETDYLNGEILLLGRLHGVPTPANRVVAELATGMARAGDPPGSMPEHELEVAVRAAGVELPG